MMDLGKQKPRVIGNGGEFEPLCEICGNKLELVVDPICEPYWSCSYCNRKIIGEMGGFLVMLRLGVEIYSFIKKGGGK